MRAGDVQGAHKAGAGNHEYLTPGASGYFRYFGGRALPRRGY